MPPSRKVVACACLLLACVLACAAQGGGVKRGERERPRLSGTWSLDKSKSDFGPFKDSEAARADVTLEVVHSEPEVKITRRAKTNGREQVQELAYYTDGRGELNPATLGRVGVKSNTKWDGNKLVARSTVTRNTPGGVVSIDTWERWQLSSDGRTLTYTVSINSPLGTQSIKQVFTKLS